MLCLFSSPLCVICALSWLDVGLFFYLVAVSLNSSFTTLLWVTRCMQPSPFFFLCGRLVSPLTQLLYFPSCCFYPQHMSLFTTSPFYLAWAVFSFCLLCSCVSLLFVISDLSIPPLFCACFFPFYFPPYYSL